MGDEALILRVRSPGFEFTGCYSAGLKPVGTGSETCCDLIELNPGQQALRHRDRLGEQTLVNKVPA
jgi:hypothetical protein